MSVTKQELITQIKGVLEKIRHISSNAGHAPCRSGGISEEGVVPNVCLHDFAIEINELAESTLNLVPQLLEAVEGEGQSQKDFNALLILVARTLGGEEWADADDDQILEEFDPWHALRSAPGSSQPVEGPEITQGQPEQNVEQRALGWLDEMFGERQVPARHRGD